MAQHLVVNGKEYLTSAEIAQSFGYTPDYVSRLAREGKIVATNVNRKWFINAESVEEFVRSVDVGKEIRSDELKKQRKVERLMHSEEMKKERVGIKVVSHIALAQSFAVLLCGAFVGLLGWSATSANMTLADIAVGFEKSYTQIVDAVIPDQNPLALLSSWASVASVQESVVQSEDEAEPSSVVNIDHESQTVDEEVVTQKQYEAVNFSDAVNVRFADDGTGTVRPIITNEKDGKEYQMLLAPITSGG